jgi:hypothetical protein
MNAHEIGIFLFIFVAGTLGTDIWRWIGVFSGSRLDEESEALAWVKSVATALVAGVIASQVLYPGGVLAAAPVSLRVGAAFFGFAVFLAARKNLAIGILAAMAALAAGLYAIGF